MKKGFTLIEILGVITILALVLILILPSLIGIIKSKNSEKDEYTIELINNAADIYIKNNLTEFPKITDKKYCIPIKQLINSGYLKEPIELNQKNIVDTSGVLITYNDKYNKEITKLEECLSGVN